MSEPRQVAGPHEVYDFLLPQKGVSVVVIRGKSVGTDNKPCRCGGVWRWSAAIASHAFPRGEPDRSLFVHRRRWPRGLWESRWSESGRRCLSRNCLKVRRQAGRATSPWGLAEAATWGGMNSYSGGADDKLHAARKDIVAMELRVLAALSYRLTVSYFICFVYFFWYLRWAWISLFIYLVDEPKISLYRRETDRDLRSACRCVADFTVLNFSERAVWGVCCQTFPFVLFSLFRRPRAGLSSCKVVFSGWQPIR